MAAKTGGRMTGKDDTGASPAESVTRKRAAGGSSGKTATRKARGTSPAIPSEPAPVLIIASRESGGSLVSALLGAHPAFYSPPQINLLAFDVVWQFIKYGAIPRDSILHGTLRFLGEALTGEQTVQSVQAAQRWLARRADDPAAKVHAALRGMVAPRRFVDYSPLVAQNADAMQRAIAALPETTVIIHLTRDPLSQGRAMCLPVWQSIMTSLDFWDRRGLYQAAMDVFEVGEQLIDWSVTPPVFDPQFAWHRTQAAARTVQAGLPPERWVHVDMGALARDPATVLGGLLDRLGEAADAETVAAMCRAGVTDYLLPGPYQASFGMDFEMIGVPVAEALDRERKMRRPCAIGDPLPWRGDGDTLLPEVAGLATDLGYDLAK